MTTKPSVRKSEFWDQWVATRPGATSMWPTGRTFGTTQAHAFPLTRAGWEAALRWATRAEQ